MVAPLAAGVTTRLSADDAGTPLAPSAVLAVTGLALRLGRVMRPDYVTTWLLAPGIEALGGERPIDLIARGDMPRVEQLVSELEDPGAT
jgi:hypothetical protein